MPSSILQKFAQDQRFQFYTECLFKLVQTNDELKLLIESCTASTLKNALQWNGDTLRFELFMALLKNELKNVCESCESDGGGSGSKCDKCKREIDKSIHRGKKHEGNLCCECAQCNLLVKCGDCKEPVRLQRKPGCFATHMMALLGQNYLSNVCCECLKCDKVGAIGSNNNTISILKPTTTTNG